MLDDRVSYFEKMEKGFVGKQCSFWLFYSYLHSIPNMFFSSLSKIPIRCGAEFSKHRPFGPMLSISQFVHMCVCLSVCVCVSVYLSVCSLLRYRFAPTSQSRMSSIFRHSESLGKSNGKKRSQYTTKLLIQCVEFTLIGKFSQIKIFLSEQKMSFSCSTDL